ncbi:MAG TPA: trehalose-phosphatase [Bryobacteraceae bacterium]|nr:trehalose-phosphatase [Bryobacteraceae bacterium]
MTEPLISNLPTLASEIGRAAHLFLGVDFDGTLAPIVSNPADARVPDETRVVLEELAARRNFTIAVVSGRGLADLCSRVGSCFILAGNHGLEIMDEGFHWCHPDALKCQPLLRAICEKLRVEIGGITGALIEDKGLTASVHYRNVAPDEIPRLTETVKSAVAPHVDRFLTRRGKKVTEILPRVPWHKGSAIHWMLDRLGNTVSGETAVCYIGDDATDECAFRYLPAAITVRVGTSNPTSARFQVRDTGQVYEFLNWLRISFPQGDSRDSRAPVSSPPQP